MPHDVQPLPLDPALLAAFREQGALIVAHERGLTAVCRVKLAGVARKLGIADEQIEQAIRSLAVIEPSAPPNRQAERFRRRLRKDLSGKSRTIIGPTIEAQILSAARRKYALDEALAGQVIAEVTAELGLTRISASDAIQSLATQIDQAAGSSSWLARESWDRLRSAGAKWGLELEVIDELIDERLAANRSAYLRSTTSTRATLNIAIAAVVVTGVIIGLLFLARAARDKSTPVTGAESTAIVPRPRPTTTPIWWDVDLSVEMAHAKSQIAPLAAATDFMASNDANKRAVGYEQLIDQVRSSAENHEILRAAQRIAAGCYALETDDAAAGALRSALVNVLPSTGRPLPRAKTPWTAEFWATDTASALLNRRGASAERKVALADVLASVFGESIDMALTQREQQKRMRQLTALAAYRQLTAAAVKEPSSVAVLYPSLSQRSAALLADDEFLRAETSFLAVAAPAAGSDWKVYERPLARCISSPDPLPALRLVDALRRASDKKFVEHLSRLLLVRAGARPKSQNKSDVIAAVRQALTGGANLTAADRWMTLQEEAASVLEKPVSSNERELLMDCVSLAHLTTLAIALAQGDAGFASFDAGLAHSPQLSGESSSESLPVDEAQQLIAESYRQWALLLSASPTVSPAVSSPAEALESCITALTGGKTSDPFLVALPHEQTALRYLAGDNLRYTVGLQRLMIELSARRAAAQRPQRAAMARRIAAEARDASANAKSVLVQLRVHEAALLKLWTLYAPEA